VLEERHRLLNTGLRGRQGDPSPGIGQSHADGIIRVFIESPVESIPRGQENVVIKPIGEISGLLKAFRQGWKFTLQGPAAQVGGIRGIVAGMKVHPAVLVGIYP